MNTIQRVKQSGNFTIIPNVVFKSGLSLRAIGLLTFILHLPDDWVLYKTWLYENVEEGRDAVKTAWKELEDKGYLVTVRTKAVNGGLPEINYIVYDMPNKMVDFQSTGSRRSETKLQETSPLISTNLLNPKGLNTKEENTEHIAAQVPRLKEDLSEWTGEQEKKHMFQYFENNPIGKMNDAIGDLVENALILTAPKAKEKKPRAGKMVPPSQAEVHAVFIAKGKVRGWPEDYCKLEADKFFMHYGANGWMQGRGKPIVDWKLAAGGWIGRSNEFKAPAYQAKSDNEAKYSKTYTQEPVVSADPRRDLQYMYERFLGNDLKAEYIDVSCYDFLKQHECFKSLPTDEVKMVQVAARNKRINQLSGSNQSSELEILKIYDSGDPVIWGKVDPVYIRVFKKMMLLLWFKYQQKNGAKNLF